MVLLPLLHKHSLQSLLCSEHQADFAQRARVFATPHRSVPALHEADQSVHLDWRRFERRVVSS